MIREENFFVLLQHIVHSRKKELSRRGLHPYSFHNLYGITRKWERGRFKVCIPIFTEGLR